MRMAAGDESTRLHYTCRRDWAWAFAAAFCDGGGTDVQRAAALPSAKNSKYTAPARARRPALLRVEEIPGAAPAAASLQGAAPAAVGSWGTSSAFDELNNKAALCQHLDSARVAGWAAPPTVCMPWDCEDVASRAAALRALPGGGDGSGWMLLKPARACHGDGIVLARSTAGLTAAVRAEAAAAGDGDKMGMHQARMDRLQAEVKSSLAAILAATAPSAAADGVAEALGRATVS